MAKMNTGKRYVVFFELPTIIKRSSRTTGQITIRMATGPVDAYRKATGWKGRVAAGKGYSNQMPARQIYGYHKLTNNDDWVELHRVNPPPPTAYVVPLGNW